MAESKCLSFPTAARCDGRVYATDHIEYDIAVAPGSPLKGFYYSPFKGNDSQGTELHFKRGEGIDQFGREQISGPEPKGGAWTLGARARENWSRN
jgi:hypothetical protein